MPSDLGIGDRFGPNYRRIAVLFLLEKAASGLIVRGPRGFPGFQKALEPPVPKKGKFFAILF